MGISRALGSAVFNISGKAARLSGFPGQNRVRAVEPPWPTIRPLPRCCPATRGRARGAHGARIARFVDDLGEALDLLPVGALVSGARPGVERDQVDLGRDAAQ